MQFNWKNKNLIVVLVFILGIGIFSIFYFNSLDKVEVIPEDNTSLDDWTVENSPLNGLPLIENKTIYKVDQPDDLDTIYITVFPTETEDGVIDFSIFDLHTTLNKTFNPTLYANVVVGDSNGNLSNLIDTSLINSIIRVRGNSSRGAAFKSYKIKFTTENDNYKGFTVLNLNKHVSDPSKIANKFSFDMMSQLDNMASLRTNFVKIYIRDASLPEGQSKYVYYGLYTNIEQPNKDFLTSHGLDANGSLYKATSFEFHEYDALKNVDDPSYDQAAFEEILEIREGNDHSKLIQMLKDINDMNIDFDVSFKKYFNEDNYLTWLAMNILLGNEDTLAHNFIMYNPTNSLTWYLLPWDYDGTFKFGEADTDSKAPTSLQGVQRLTAVLLHRRYFLSSENVDKLTQKMDELLATTFSKTNVDKTIDGYLPVIESTLGKNPDVGLLRMEPNQLLNYVRGFYGEIKNNYDDYITALNYPTPVFTATPTENSDGTTYFTWESARDFEGDLIKYSIRLAKDPSMNQIIFAEDNLVVTEFTYNGDLQGTYYLEVRSIDSDGNSQYSLDTYKDPFTGNHYFGIRQLKFE
ncbi:MAG TPA: CotH kinase family protein [Erysipelotrichaceae bacterium]|nr:CotH kinase family protein [Erysipelotrichaceae bacterium]